jgi:tRNA(Ser,Leu) C12 N-acetylase TAN1
MDSIEFHDRAPQIDPRQLDEDGLPVASRIENIQEITEVNRRILVNLSDTEKIDLDKIKEAIAFLLKKI